MFKAELKDKLEKIFDGMKVTFDAPSESFEQDTIFVNIADAPSRVLKGRIVSRVNGFIQIFAQHEKLQFGYMSRKIEQAETVDTENLFFFGVDQENAASQARLMNLSERRAQFVFLFSKQYDPNQGSLDSITMEGTFAP